MVFRVKIGARARNDLREIGAYIQAASVPQAGTWLASLEGAILSLSTLPERGAPLRGRPNCRQLLYGTPPHTYRILYRVDKQAQTVYILHVRHGARAGIGI